MFGREQSAGLSVNYRLKSRVSVDSRSNQQIVRIADLSLPCVFSNVAIPQLTDLVYRKALVSNDSGISLLEGPCSVYLEGDFVGLGVIPMVATGQNFAPDSASIPSSAPGVNSFPAKKRSRAVIA